jgi:hypothetical protein
LIDAVENLMNIITTHMGESSDYISPGEDVLEALVDAQTYSELGALAAIKRTVREAENLVRRKFVGKVVVDFCVATDALYEVIRKQDFNRKRNIGRLMIQISEISVARKIARVADKAQRTSDVRKVG